MGKSTLNAKYFALKNYNSNNNSVLLRIYTKAYAVNVAVVVLIYLPVTAQRQTISFG